MYKKFTIAAIMILLLSMIFGPAVLSSETNTADASDSFEIKALLASSSSLNLTFDEEAVNESVMPNVDPIEIPINVSYTIVGFIGGLHTKLYKNREVKIELNIVEKPDWCEANLADRNLSTTPGTQEPQTTTLTVSVNETAQALTKGVVKIQATCSAIKGLFGIITKVTGCNESLEIPLIVGYLPLIEVEFGNYPSEVPPFNVTTIPVNITNLGNGKTVVTIEVQNESGNYSIFDAPESVVIDSPLSGNENKKLVEIMIKPYKNFTEETIKISFTPHFNFDTELKGETIVGEVTLKNDGSYVEEDESEINSILLLVVIVVIILVLIFAIILKKRK